MFIIYSLSLSLSLSQVVRCEMLDLTKGTFSPELQCEHDKSPLISALREDMLIEHFSTYICIKGRQYMLIEHFLHTFVAH